MLLLAQIKLYHSFYSLNVSLIFNVDNSCFNVLYTTQGLISLVMGISVSDLKVASGHSMDISGSVVLVASAEMLEKF